MNLYIGKPVGANVNFYKGPYQHAFTGSAVYSGTGLDLDQAIASLTIDDALAAGQRRPVRIQFLTSDGRLGQSMELITSVENDPAG